MGELRTFNQPIKVADAFSVVVGGVTPISTDASGNLTLSATKQGVISGSPATVQLTAAQSGSLCLFDAATGIKYTLPPSVPGTYFEFYVSVSASSATHEVDVPTSSFLGGGVQMIIDASATTLGAVANGTSHVKIAMNGTTTGGVKGTAFTISCISSTVWLISGLVSGSGSLQTPIA